MYIKKNIVKTKICNIKIYIIKECELDVKTNWCSSCCNSCIKDIKYNIENRYKWHENEFNIDFL